MSAAFSGQCYSFLLGRLKAVGVWLTLLCASTIGGWAQVSPPQPTAPVKAPQPATRPQSVPKANLPPKVLVTPSAQPLTPAQLEEALRLLLRTDSVSRRHIGIEAEGLVLDQALTKPGHDFYDLFYSAFEAPPGSASFTVLVSERPGRGNNSLVVLTVNDQELIEVPLPTRFDQMQDLVAESVELAQGYLAQAQNVSRQLESGRRTPLEVY
jgi:curli production assembly/transport component CsgE